MDAALKLAPTTRDVQIEAALALAIANDITGAEALADSLNKRFPLDTTIQSVWLPMIDGQIALLRKSPSSTVEKLQAALPYELGESVDRIGGSCTCPAYVRGQAYLEARQGVAAAAEFQKILDHRGLVRGCPTAALAHLGLGRAYVLQGDSAKARAAYQDFLTLWKDADADIPILSAAKSEYAKIR